jgi:large subunit ribosomal protein L15
LKQKINTINVGELDELVDKLANAKQLETREEKAFLDLAKLGYNKLLATGRITKPIVVKVAAHSESAAKKVEEAGGQILGATATEEEEFEESAETEKKVAKS